MLQYVHQHRDEISITSGLPNIYKVLNDYHTCKKYGSEEETAEHILCECDLASLRHTYPGSFLLDPQDIMNLSIGAIWKFAKGTGLV